MTLSVQDTTDLAVRAGHIGAEVAAPFADEVDAASRFPHEAMEALRADQQLSALVPRDLGGAGATISEVSAATCALARHCGSTGMVYAMHQLGVSCLVRHGNSDHLRNYVADIAREQLLLATATTELGTGGDIGSSNCAVQDVGHGCFHLEKQAPVISYGQFADGILVTARRSPECTPNDQVLVLCAPPGLVLEPLSTWNALGFRGTCSSGFRLVADGERSAVLAEGFNVISAETNVPVSHILWAHVWLGLAASAVHRARTFVQSMARRKPGTTPHGALRLAELDARYRQMVALVRGAAARFDEISDDRRALSMLDYTVEMNALKVSASTLVVDVVSRAMVICGMAGYSEDSPFSMGRLIRDAHGAALMLNNDRLLGHNAQMLLAARGAL